MGRGTRRGGEEREGRGGERKGEGIENVSPHFLNVVTPLLL
jgi:hypothetical protein